MEFSVERIHARVIHSHVKMLQLNTGFQFSAVYGLHTINNRKKLWQELQTIATQMSGPRVMMGDFNPILSIEDRLYGNPVQEVEVIDFKEFLQQSGMMELKSVGRYYTWTNHQIHSKIDRILVNAEWICKWPHLEGIIMDPHFSDHYPLKIPFEIVKETGTKSFKFFNYLVEHQDFMQAMETIWRKPSNLHSMQMVWLKFKQLKVVMKRLAKREPGKVEDTIAQIKAKLKDIQI